ncbi:MAG TPA: hypothetical protein VFA33_07425 [Bryobacteraceae bacterium]|nr:hypothetical protein [Bryobacteraceae bacterium]
METRKRWVVLVQGRIEGRIYDQERATAERWARAIFPEGCVELLAWEHTSAEQRREAKRLPLIGEAVARRLGLAPGRPAVGGAR